MSCHLAAHGWMGTRERERGPELAEKSRQLWRCKRTDTECRPGDTCPNCGGRLYSVQTFYSRQDGLRYVYIACPKRSGGCGHRAGSYTTPLAES
jgi:hypothetical protein